MSIPAPGTNGVVSSPRPPLTRSVSQAGGDFLQNAITMLHNTFASGKHRGRRLLGVGIGPYTCVYSVASASRLFPSITLSCQASHKLHELQQWVDRKMDMPHWGAIFNYLSTLENGETGKSIENRVRNGTKTIVPCDITRRNPFGSQEQEPFDCVITALCMESTRDRASYERAVNNVKEMLTPGGTVVILGVLNRKYFEIGKDALFPQTLTIEDVFDIFGRVGFVERESTAQSFPSERMDYIPMPEWNGYFLMTARRPYTCNSENCKVDHNANHTQI